MPSISDMIQALFGSDGSPAPTVHNAAPLTEYPTSEDAAFARKQDYSYGHPSAPYFTGSRFNLLSGSPNQRPMQTTGVSGDVVRRAGFPDDFYAKGLLAANNSALATLGFDPSVVAADYGHDPKTMTVLGLYRPFFDQIYANARDPSTIVHESIHRGTERLRDSPNWDPAFEPWVIGNDKSDANNEAIVRYLMETKMGNPEASSTGSADISERTRAKRLFEQGPTAKANKKILDQMEAAAAQYLANKHPMGPR